MPEHGMATIWDADVLIWAASQIVAAENDGFTTSRFFRFMPYQLLRAVGRATGNRDYLLLKAALARLQSTVIATTIRNGKHWRRRQFSWINEWEEMTTRTGRVEGMEFVLPEWFYNSVIDRSLVLTIDPAYFRLTGGIERWLYRAARKHAGRQPEGWAFEISQPDQGARTARCTTAQAVRPFHGEARLHRARRTAPEARCWPAGATRVSHWPHRHRGRNRDGRGARPRPDRPRSARLAGLPRHRPRRTLPHELGGPGQPRRPLFRTDPRKLRHRPSGPALDR